MSQAAAYPVFPPGFWRRIEIDPRPGMVTAGLEDDVHRFELRLTHCDGIVLDVDAVAVRFPWSPCPGGAPHLAETIRGRRLEEIANLDARIECTHLFDLAVLCAAYADLPEPLRFDMKVADRVAERTTATLEANGAPALSWRLDGTLITGPTLFEGRDLRAFSRWRGELSLQLAREAGMLRRAVFVSGARRQPERMPNLAAMPDASRLGACYRYQPPQAFGAVQSPGWRRDFSHTSIEPLHGFDPRLSHS
jgi:hypothetical protein